MFQQDSSPNNGRRHFMLSGIASAVALAGFESAVASTYSNKNAHVVIVGSGSAGISLANRLVRALPNGKVTIIDRKEPHFYWPGLTLVASGLWPKEKVLYENADFLPSRANWIKEMVKEYDPANNTLTTDAGQKIKYDFLVVASGIEYHYNAIEGMDVNAIGTNGLASVYYSPDKAAASWTAIHKFSVNGGNGFFTLPAGPIRCAGAPLKMTFLTIDRLKQNGGMKNAKVEFHSAGGVVFSLPYFSDFSINRWKEDGVNTQLHSALKAVDVGARKAVFKTETGDKEVAYDLLHVVPPMRAPESVRLSDLAWKEGSFAAGGWLAVNKGTLQHETYKNVFGCGDVNGTPRGKTAATVKKGVPVVEANLLSVIDGKEPKMIFDGYTSCPLLTKIGAAMLIEFDYDGKLIPTIPLVDPKKETWFAWVMKEQMLKPAYFQMLKGNV